MTKIIGTNNLGYAEQRNFAGISFDNYTFKKVHNLHVIPQKIWPFNSRDRLKYYQNTFSPLSEKEISFYHFFNAISKGKKPWITTFESSLPRYGHMSKAAHQKGLDLMISDKCKKLIAFSNCTAGIQKFILNEYPKIYQNEIAQKMIVLHPPQEKLINSIHDKPINKDVIFTFIGNAFFTKGGKEILLAFQKVKEKGYSNWKLNLVSSLSCGDYVTQSTKADVDSAMTLINSMKAHIVYYSVLQNEKVLNLLVKSDILLLPSFSDTYGYVVLEAQAAGCATITSNVRALPEINNDHTGWLLELPQNELGILKFKNGADKKRVSDLLSEQLVFTLKEILDDPEKIKEKAQNSLERIDKKHSIANHKFQLEGIYKTMN